MLNLFEEVESRQYIWKLFFLVNGLTPSEDKVSVREIEDIVVTKKMSSGFGINLTEEEALLNRCKNIRVFTREIELALLAGDKEMYLYASKDGSDVEIQQIGVVGKYVYISPQEVASPVFITEGENCTDKYFPVLKEYALKGHAEVSDYAVDYKDKVFTLRKGDEELCKIENADKSLSYPFVLYLLVKLASKQPSVGFEGKFDVKRIRRKE